MQWYKRANRVSHSRFLTLVLFAFFTLGMLFSLSGQANADEEPLPTSGTATGSNGLDVAWKTEMNISGMEKSDEDSMWLVVTPSIQGQELPAIYLEGYHYGLPEDFELVTVEDYNFDGNDDLWLCEGMSARGAYGVVYLYNPQTKQFEFNENFNSIPVVGVDKEQKKVISVYHGSAVENGMQEYIVKGFDELELVYEEGTESPDDLYEKNQYRSFERTYKDGKLVSEKEEIHSLDEE